MNETSYLSQEKNDGKTNNIFDKLVEKIRQLLVDAGIMKAEKQERVEGESVDEWQEHEMNLYLQQQVAQLNKDEQFSKKNWEKASLEERKNILQEYITSIAAIMGLPAVTIYWDYAQSENGYAKMGFYSSETDTIAINEWVLDKGDEEGFPSYNLLSTVVHEMRHYYQQEAVRNPDQYVVTEETIQAWEESFINYKSKEEFMEDGMSESDAYKAYRDQAVETDARWFAKQR